MWIYEGCPGSIRPSWISREPVSWPWWNLAANQRTLHCPSMNSHSPVGLVSRQWDAADWAYVLCDRHIYGARANRSMRLSILQLSCRIFCQSITSPRSAQAPLQPRFGSLRLLAFPRTKIAVEKEVISERDRHTVHKLSQRRLTADWLAPRDSYYSQMNSKVPSDWLPSYIKATRSVLEIFQMDGYFPDCPLCTQKIMGLTNQWDL